MKYVILLVVLCLFVPSFAQHAKVVIDTILITLDETEKQISVIQIDDGRMIPENYDLIGKGHFASGLFTAKCGESEMIEKVNRSAKKMGADAFRLYDVIPPNLLNTCYTAKVLFLRLRQ